MQRIQQIRYLSEHTKSIDVNRVQPPDGIDPC